MIALLIAIGIGMVLYGLAKGYQPPVSEQVATPTLTSFMRRGQIQTTVRYRYQEGDAEFQFEAQSILNEWAIEQDIPQVTRGHYQLLNSLLGEALGEYHPKVISIVIPAPTTPLEPPKEPTEAERLRADIMSKIDCGEMLMTVLDTVQKEKPEVASLFLKNNRSIARNIEDLKDEEFQGIEDALKHRVNGLFHDPHRVR